VFGRRGVAAAETWKDLRILQLERTLGRKSLWQARILLGGTRARAVIFRRRSQTFRICFKRESLLCTLCHGNSGLHMASAILRKYGYAKENGPFLLSITSICSILLRNPGSSQ
jgi:hypothetical protein